MTKELVTLLRDDFTKMPGASVATETFTWFDGVPREVELNDENRAQWNAAIAALIEVSRKAQKKSHHRKKPVPDEPIPEGPPTR
jgi:hypothetical protein